MGCLNTKPKPGPRTVVVHACDYHSHNQPNGIVRILKSRSQSPARYAATDTTTVTDANIEQDGHPNYARHKPSTQSKRSGTPTSTPSPHITLPSTPEGERSMLHVMDAEDLEPADYNPTPEVDTRTTSRLSDEKSQATVSKVTMKPANSVIVSQTMDSKQSLLSSQDTLKVEEFDSELDDVGRLSPRKPPTATHRVETPAPSSVLLPLRKQKQDKGNDSPTPNKASGDRVANDKIKHTKLKAFKAPKEKKKSKEKVKLEKVEELSTENLFESKWVVHNKETGEFKVQLGQNLLSKSVENISNTGETEQEPVVSLTKSVDAKQQVGIKQMPNESKQTKQEKQKENQRLKKESGKMKSSTEKEGIHVKKESNTIDNKAVVCEAVERKGGISLEYKETKGNTGQAIHETETKSETFTNKEKNSLEHRVASPLPKDLYQKELERVRLKRKRKRKALRRNPDDTPRVPKPGDMEAMGYLGSDVIFRNKLKPASGSILKNADLSSTENLTDFGSESRLSGISDLSSVGMANELTSNGVKFTDKSLEKDVDLYSLDSTEERNTKFFTDQKNSLILADMQHQHGIPRGPSTSDLYTKQKLLYSKYERRPHSESVLRLAGRPPLPPPDTSSNVSRPVSEKVRRAPAYSRYFTPDLDL